MHSIGESFSKAGQALQCLDVNKAQCLKAVVDSKRLVEWLRSTIKCKLRHAGASGRIEFDREILDKTTPLPLSQVVSPAFVSLPKIQQKFMCSTTQENIAFRLYYTY